MLQMALCGKEDCNVPVGVVWLGREEEVQYAAHFTALLQEYSLLPRAQRLAEDRMKLPPAI
jgi:hypothetical protein